MVQVTHIESYDDMKKYLKIFDKETKCLIYIYFEGHKDDKGASWCPDCNVAEPFVKDAFKNLADPESRVLIVDVGDRATWRDKNNAYRKDQVRLTQIPTLVRYNGVERLEGDQLTHPELLEMFFKEAQEAND